MGGVDKSAMNQMPRRQLSRSRWPNVATKIIYVILLFRQRRCTKTIIAATVTMQWQKGRDFKWVAECSDTEPRYIAAVIKWSRSINDAIEQANSLSQFELETPQMGFFQSLSHSKIVVWAEQTSNMHQHINDIIWWHELSNRALTKLSRGPKLLVKWEEKNISTRKSTASILFILPAGC